MSHSKPCAQCPWRLSNQGKRHFGGFYTKRNLIRLWNMLRAGGGMQSCHLTDPAHPDHIAAGAPENAKAQECPGSVILIRRELKQLQQIQDDIGGGPVSAEACEAYLARGGRRLTRRGLIYWALQRFGPLAGTPLGYIAPLDVDDSDPEIGLPEWM